MVLFIFYSVPKPPFFRSLPSCIGGWTALFAGMKRYALTKKKLFFLLLNRTFNHCYTFKFKLIFPRRSFEILKSKNYSPWAWQGIIIIRRRFGGQGVPHRNLESIFRYTNFHILKGASLFVGHMCGVWFINFYIFFPLWYMFLFRDLHS